MTRIKPEMQRNGLAVDATGGPIVDPSENVKALSEAANKRQDDLRELNKELTDAKLAHQKEIGEIREAHQKTVGQLREAYQEKIAHAESGRLDSIRQVDREEVAKTAVAANTAITTLAKQTADLATTLQAQVATTAAAAEARSSAQYTDVNKRISALELSSSEGKGKQGVVDPQMDRLTALVERMAQSQNTDTGRSEGVGSQWTLIGVITALVLAAGAIIVPLMQRNTPAPIVIDRPAAVTVPSAPATIGTGVP